MVQEVNNARGVVQEVNTARGVVQEVNTALKRQYLAEGVVRCLVLPTLGRF